MTKKVKCWICKRLHEPSSWAGFAINLGILGANIPSPYSYIIFSLAFACASLATLMGEKGSSNENQ